MFVLRILLLQLTSVHYGAVHNVCWVCLLACFVIYTCMESYILHKPLFQHSSKPVRGTGFIAELPVMGQNKVLLMTSYNVLPSMSVAQKSDIYFGRISDDYPGTMIKGKDLFDSDFFKTDDEEVSLVYIAFAGVAECITFSLSLQ